MTERKSFEELYAEEAKIIQGLNLEKLEVFREKLIARLDSLTNYLREEDIVEARRQYLIGVRNHVIRPLLKLTKERRAMLNRVIHCGGNSKFLKTFYEEALRYLPIHEFQIILGRTITKEQIDAQSVDSIRGFWQESKKISEAREKM